MFEPGGPDLGDGGLVDRPGEVDARDRRTARLTGRDDLECHGVTVSRPVRSGRRAVGPARAPARSGRPRSGWRTSSFRSRFDTCTLTVFLLMNSSSAISRSRRPAARCPSTSTSRSVRPRSRPTVDRRPAPARVGDSAQGDPGALGRAARCPPGAGRRRGRRRSARPPGGRSSASARGPRSLEQRLGLPPPAVGRGVGLPGLVPASGRLAPQVGIGRGAAGTARPGTARPTPTSAVRPAAAPRGAGPPRSPRPARPARPPAGRALSARRPGGPRPGRRPAASARPRTPRAHISGR